MNLRMASLNQSFDSCMNTFPAIREPGGMAELWDYGLQELKKTPVNPNHRLLLKKSLGRELHYEVTFTGFGGSELRGLLSLPRRKKGIPAVVQFHDYNSPILRSGSFTDRGIAHLSLELRGHNTLENLVRPVKQAQTDGEIKYFDKHPLEDYRQDDARSSWLFASMMDAVRAIDFLRLQKEVDNGKIGVYGQGFGAAMAIAAASHRKNSVRALVLEKPSFLWVAEWLKLSSSPLASDLKQIMSIQKPTVLTKVKKSLEIIDPLLFAEDLEQNIMVSTHMDDTSAPPLPAFALFHHVLTEKAMHVYMEKGQDPDDKKKTEKASEFLMDLLKPAHR